MKTSNFGKHNLILFRLFAPSKRIVKQETKTMTKFYYVYKQVTMIKVIKDFAIRRIL